jgi:C4-dicarboxylate-specific signal transduction histidine kinase
LKCNNHVVIPGRVVQFTVLNKISKLKERVKELSKGLKITERKDRNKRRNVALLKDVIDLEEKYLEKKIQLIALSSRDDAEVDLKTVL